MRGRLSFHYTYWDETPVIDRELERGQGCRWGGGGGGGGDCNSPPPPPPPQIFQHNVCTGLIKLWLKVNTFIFAKL